MTEKEAIEFCKRNPEVAAKIILMVERLEERIKELEDKLNMNSSNSSKPPFRKRQVFDLPPMNIEVTEYQSHKVCRPNCQKVNQEAFSSYVKAVTQYGSGLKSFVSYLNAHHMLPYERISELIEDIVKHKISTGSIYNFLSENYDNLEGFEEELKKRLLQEEVLHADETCVNVQGKLKWIHTATCETAVHYGVHNKRGKKAIDNIDILPKYQGILLHDHWRPYNKFDRLIRYQEETLRFIDGFRVPFTNNIAERDFRMIKVKEKISGTFTSFRGTEFFCHIKSFIATLKKNNLSFLDGLKNCYTFQTMKSLGW